MAKRKYSRDGHGMPVPAGVMLPVNGLPVADTIKTLKSSAKGDGKVKEVPNAKRQPKPEKVDNNGQPADQKEKPKRERRPDGMERPPEIPRRNDN